MSTVHIAIHDVKSIELEAIHSLEGGCYTRQMTVHDKDGTRTEITFFSYHKESVLVDSNVTV